MKPMFDRDAQLVGWFDDDDEGSVFDLNLEWVAFNSDGDIHSATTLNWLGPLVDGTFQDTAGKAAFWLEDASPVSSGATPIRPMSPLRPLSPLAPLKPLRPLTPLKPLTPVGGWSSVDWNRWLSQ